MPKVLVSFTTRPGQGSEGGVGWAFTSQAASWAQTRREKVFIVIDERDYASVSKSLGEAGGATSLLTLVPVPVPRVLLRKYGDSRTRETYLGWMTAARSRVGRLVSTEDVDVVHQVTFATTSLPHVLPRDKKVRTIWGPVAMPIAPVAPEGKSPSAVERAGVWGLQRLASHNAKNIDLLIATNASTRDGIGSAKAVLEPNIFVSSDDIRPLHVEDDVLTICGLLINRKRPWLAVQAMRDPRLACFRLNVVGDGVLRPGLESYVRQERLEKRVNFLGRVDQRDALQVIASSRALLHPACREGAAWVIGEAAALGVPAVAFAGSGSDSTIALSNNGGHIVRAQAGDLVSALVDGVLDIVSRPRPCPIDRWSVNRIPKLLDYWWASNV